MKVVLGSDHAGFALKELVKEHLKSLPTVEVSDVGTFSPDPVDYPDIAFKAAHAVAEGKADRGILICGTGIGMSIAANKVRGIRAARCEDPVSAHLARSHNDARVLTMGGRTAGTELAKAAVDAFLKADFEGGRHARRVDKITAVEGNLRKLAK